MDRFLCLLSVFVCYGVEGMLNYTPKNDCYRVASSKGMCGLLLLEGFYSGKDPEELVQEEHPLASEESCCICSWLATLARLGHHISFFIK